MEKKCYIFMYLSEIHVSNPRTGIVTSTIEVKEGDNVIIEKKGRGIFLGRILQETPIEADEYDNYKIVKKANVSAYFEAIEKEKRKEELIAQMEEKFREIDKIRKFEYYANLDEEFRGLYDEYKSL